MAFDLDHYFSLQRAGSLLLSPDGQRVVTTVAQTAPDGKSMRSAAWLIGPATDDTPRRLTWSAAGETAAGFLSDGSLLFVSARPDPDLADAPPEPRGALWCLPNDGGEAFLVTDPPAGVGGVAVARDCDTMLVVVDLHRDATDIESDRTLADDRKQAGVTAQLFDMFPIRHWDHYLGPRQRRYFVVKRISQSEFSPLRQIAVGDPGLNEGGYAISPDGDTIYVHAKRSTAPRDLTGDIVAISVDGGERTVLTDGDFDHDGPTVSPDGHFLACVRESIGTPDEPGDQTVWLIDLRSGEQRDLTPALDRFPRDLTWSPDSKRLYFVADDMGYAPLYSVTVSNGRVSTVAGQAAFGSPCPTPNGRSVYAMRSHIDSPAAAIKLAASGRGDAAALATPGTPGKLPGRLRDIPATATDGTTIRSWLVTPPGTSRNKPAPLVVWVHGGPLGSWNDWSWRWNPWLLSERGYAVLLPDPAISTGYGLEHIRRGHGAWGDAPYTDVMAAVDAACARPDIDADRIALMGGSFGGYMANWVAGHTDRFRCIVTHASLWALDQFWGTTDGGPWWEPEFGDPYDPANTRYTEHSPHHSIGQITTPMLVIHGELDHRVPIGEALRLWTDLQMHGVESKFLYFPDENHWVLKPQNARLWYETVFAWLDRHLLGTEWTQPPLL